MLNEITYLCRKDLDLTERMEERINYLITEHFRKKPKVMIMERDVIFRPYFLNFQKAFEEFLIEQSQEVKVKNIVCLIHTSKPAKPLCNPREKLIKETVKASVIRNPNVFCRLF